MWRHIGIVNKQLYLDGKAVDRIQLNEFVEIIVKDNNSVWIKEIKK